MSKLHKLTNNVCLCCTEEIGHGKCVFLHKTRRQSHILCIDCAHGYISPIVEKATDNLRNGIFLTNMSTITCPGSYHGEKRNQCSCKIRLENLKVPEDTDLYTGIFRFLYALRTPNAEICKNKKCGNVVDLGEWGETIVKCTECNTQWCRSCGVCPYHEGMTCLEYELREDKSQNALYLKEMNKKGELKLCPSCGVPSCRVTTDDGRKLGCNKMICGTCGVKWCWLCGASNIDYDHFNSLGKNPCSNKLWV